MTGSGTSSKGSSTDTRYVGHTERKEVPAIKIVLDITRLVEEGKLTTEAARLQALAKRDTGSLAINVLMAFGAVAVAAGIIALEPAFTTGAVLGVALVVIGLGISFLAVEQWGLLGTATTIIGALLLAGGVIGFVEADFAGLAFSALLFLALAVADPQQFLDGAGAVGARRCARQQYRLHARRLYADGHRTLDHDRVLCAPGWSSLRNFAARRASL